MGHNSRSKVDAFAVLLIGSQPLSMKSHAARKRRRLGEREATWLSDLNVDDVSVVGGHWAIVHLIICVIRIAGNMIGCQKVEDS